MKFVEGKGFYIVLFLCVAVIGVSAWTLNLTTRNTGMDLIGSLTNELQDVQTVTIPTLTPTGTPAPPPAYPSANEEGSSGSAVIPSPSVTATPSPAEPTPAAETKPEPTPDAPVIAPVDNIPNAFIWPVAGGISRSHAVETLMYDRTMQDWRTHRGIDIEAELGATVKCAADGVVESVISEPMFGTSVTVRHSGGLCTVYRNLSEEPTVGENQNVKMGDIIGSVGQTANFEIGDVTHLHFEAVLNGAQIDPTELLPNR
jgi:murein DD-endopeptidase MepM/ murein hydrolase activator NlpD